MEFFELRRAHVLRSRRRSGRTWRTSSRSVARRGRANVEFVDLDGALRTERRRSTRSRCDAEADPAAWQRAGETGAERGALDVTDHGPLLIQRQRRRHGGPACDRAPPSGSVRHRRCRDPLCACAADTLGDTARLRFHRLAGRRVLVGRNAAESLLLHHMGQFVGERRPAFA